MPAHQKENNAASAFSRQLLAWYETHGRKDLPWQKNITPYRVWVSEIMLQQTQVNTVIPYFERFVTSYPAIEKLADAEDDDVMHHWSGLGYYSRARNLHKTAKIIATEYRGTFPNDLTQLQSLPGIGRSTAGAILATAFEIPTPILDGNVKRVLARHEGIDGWPGKSAVANALWDASAALTPPHSARRYTQAIMDLGATLCTRSKPACNRCPVQTTCVAQNEQRISELPGKKNSKPLPVKHTHMYLVVNSQQQVLLEKRPPTGIWGGLWSFPESAELPVEKNSDSACHWPTLRHTFSHYHLDITPVVVQGELSHQVMDNSRLVWYKLDQPQTLGLAAPVSKLLAQLQAELGVNL